MTGRNGWNGRSIETAYAGHDFRSRLEARWAVFMDGKALGTHPPLWVPWRYEVEGVMLPGRGAYLPDFELGPAFTVEVKGADANLDVDRCELYCRATGRNLLILGDVPRPDDQGLHLMWACVSAGHGVWWQLWRWWFAADTGVIIPQGFDWPREAPIVNGVSCAVAGVRRLDLDEQPQIDTAYTAAKSARFEFGQTPRRTTP